MSTRSVIARTTGSEGQFSGRYVHADGYPTGLGAELWKLLHQHFKSNLSAMLAYLIDAKHAQCGWSALVGKDFSLRPAYTWERATADGACYAVYSKRDDYRRPQCYGGRKGETPYLFTEKDFEGGTDVEWLYAFDEENRKLFIRDVSAKEDVAVIELDGSEPNWTHVECGENFERCSHYAWHHGLAPKFCNLGTQTLLGRRPLEFRDVIAFVIDGKRYATTGCGGDSDFFNSRRGTQFPKNAWIATVKAKNGRQLDLPVAKRTANGFEPFDGVTWVYPPTQVNLTETLVSV